MIDKVFGTGGIGTGIVFQLENDETLGRNESRFAFLTDYRDYCKAHIILHYVSRLTNVPVYAIGKVGDDTRGESLLQEMRAAGIRVDFVEKTANIPTMFSICFQYPNGEGGNITSSNSACNHVHAAYIEACTEKIDKNSLVLAAPEIPLSARIRLLELGKSKGATTVSSFLSSEAADFKKAGGLCQTDILSINLEEAQALSGSDEITTIMQNVSQTNSQCKVIVTAGNEGLFASENGKVEHFPCFPAQVMSTAGAGDAVIGGTIAGIVSGKNFLQSVQYGLAAAKFAVESAHSIAESVTIKSINHYLESTLSLG